jgi:RNA recognition motif-containing protein
MSDDYKMALDDVIKKRIKEEKGGIRRRRKYYYKKNGESKPKVDNRRRLRVENLNKDMQNPQLAKLFEPYGKLTRCGIKYNKLGSSTGIADIEYSTHEECEKAISKLDNADISGVEMRVKYAAGKPFSGRFQRRTRSAGSRRRTARKIDRLNRRGARNRRMRTSGRGMGRRVRMGTSSGRVNFRTKRRFFARTLGRRRRGGQKQN